MSHDGREGLGLARALLVLLPLGAVVWALALVGVGYLAGWLR